MDEAEHADVLAYMTFAARSIETKLHSTDPLERLNKEVKRAEPTSSGIFPR